MYQAPQKIDEIEAKSNMNLFVCSVRIETEVELKFADEFDSVGQ